MGKLFDEAKKEARLHQAWRKIRENGYRSRSEVTRTAVSDFDKDAIANIRRIQRRLRDNSFEFDAQFGVTKRKSSGNGKRGIVMASVENRVVERSLLNTLQSSSPFVKNVIQTPTSVGGVPDRSVPHGLKFIADRISDGCVFYLRSDISGFFDHVPRSSVIEKIASTFDDSKFMQLLDRATTVTLANESSLGEDRAVFPTDDEGVAQGSPLSPLFGNILLNDFDHQFNKDGVFCVRFIDDFVFMSKDATKIQKAFESAKYHLENLKLKCHDPFQNPNPDKAGHGRIADGFDFLGYHILPGLLQPSKRARSELLQDIKDRLSTGKRHIMSIKGEPHSDNSQRYVQTLVGIDQALRGWGNAFAYHNCPSTIEDLDIKIDKELADFRSWYASLVKGLDWKIRRRTGGIVLLTDVAKKSLNDVPFKVTPGGQFVRSSKTLTVSTDGSVEGSRRRGRDKGNGGWAYLVHETKEERSGSAQDVTNNQMELRAVIEALQNLPKERSLIIRTDSQYVHKIASGANVTKSNGSMWQQYQELAKDRKIKIVWIKGHSGDVHNERVDALAKAKAMGKEIS